MLHTRFLDRHPRIYYSVMVFLFLLGPVLILIGGGREPLFSSDERMFFVPGEYELKLDRPWDYALFHEEQPQDQKALERIWDSGEIRYPDGVSVQIRGKESGPVALPVGVVRGWQPDDGGSAIVDAFEIPFERADTYLISIRREGGPPRFATRIYLQRRMSLGTGRAIAGLGAAAMLASLLLALGSRKPYPRPKDIVESSSSKSPPPKWLTILTASAFAAGACLLGLGLVLLFHGSAGGSLTFFGVSALGILLVLGSAGMLMVGIGLSLAPAICRGLKESRVAAEARTQADVTSQRKGQVVSSPVTLFKEVKEAPDRIVFAPQVHPWMWVLLLLLGTAFAGGGAMVLRSAIEHSPARQAAQRIHLLPGSRLPMPDSGLADWAFGLGFIAVGGLMFFGGLYLSWTFNSLIVNPEKRELVRKIALRWPAWTLTKSWQASDIDGVYLDEHVTVWPGTPTFLRSIGSVEPRETSEGHVWIRLRTGKKVDCGKGAWEDASALAGRLGGLLGAPKTLRERFEVGPPPSNDTSS